MSELLRLEVLEYSLDIEQAINNLLLIYLGIIGKKSTKLFSNKTGISLKNKVDLLLDIDVFSNEEAECVILFMNFRNIFMHDIESSSFVSALNRMSNEVKNKFKKYLNSENSLKSESECREAFKKIHIKNLKVISAKIKEKHKVIEEKAKIVKAFLQTDKRLIDLSFEFIHDLLALLASADLENPAVKNLSTKIMNKCNQFSDIYKTDKRLLKLFDKQKKMIEIKNFFIK
jgi:hypothetical protein